MKTTRSLLAPLAVAATLGCGRAGDVWEIDRAEDRAGAPAALLAYVSGLHLMVLDGDDALAGMIRVTARSRPGGGRMLRLSPSLEAELTPTEKGMELRFPTGEIVPMRKKAPGGALAAALVLVAPVSRQPNGEPLDPGRADVAGLRVGVKLRDLAATLTRLVGPATRRPPGHDAFARFTGALGANEDGCHTSIGHRRNPGPGAVCVTAFFDDDDVVRSVRIERLFPWFDGEVFREILTGRYGEAAVTRSAGDRYALGWGPTVDQTLLFDRSGPPTALAAYYSLDQDFMGRSGNAVPRIRVVLQLVDAGWASR